MRVYLNNKLELIQFNQLSLATCFIWDDKVWFKISDTDKNINAVCLSNGLVISLRCNTMIEPKNIVAREEA